MPNDREEWIDRIKAAEHQYITARFAAQRLRTDLKRDPSIEARTEDRLYVKETLRDLEVTYFVRMFAVFESGLRSFWRSVKPTKRPRTEHLIQGVASNRKIKHELIVSAHAARIYRNSIVHDNEQNEHVTPIPIADAQRNLVLFFERLPYKW